MKFLVGTIDVWMLIPNFVCIIHPKREIEIGFYFIKYFLTLNINLK